MLPRPFAWGRKARCSLKRLDIIRPGECASGCEPSPLRLREHITRIMQVMEIRPGLYGKYELQERLGRGGMAEVWKAFDPRLQRFVAIKFLQATLQSDPTFVMRF